MSDSFNRVLDRMRKIIHRVNAPCVPCIVVGKTGNAVKDRIAHVNIRCAHIDLRAQDF